HHGPLLKDYPGWAFASLGHAVCFMYQHQLTGRNLSEHLPHLIRLAEAIASELSAPPSPIGYPLQVPKLPTKYYGA
ncbi:MAG TPA: hypothetical protein DCE41_02260, partial [Cytophagales bacterium]|nr:hypothetical protein [Cytophagales bacterium]